MLPRPVLCLAFVFAAGTATAADLDRYGDPLPPGAVARLGTVRWRIASTDLAVVPCFSPDGKSIAAAGSRSVRLWETATGKTIWRALIMGPPHQLLFSPDGNALAVGDGNRVRMLNGKTGRMLCEFDHRKPGDRIEAIAFSPDSRWLAVATVSRYLTIWDTQTFDRVFEKIVELEGDWMRLEFSNRGKHLVVIEKSKLTTWDWAAQKVVSSVPLPGAILAALPANNGTHFAAFEFNSKGVTLIDWKTRKPLQAIAPERASFQWAAFSADGKQFAIACFQPGKDQFSVHISDGPEWHWSNRLCILQASSVHIAVSLDLKTALTTGDASIRVWDVDSGRRMNPSPSHEGQIAALAFTPDGSTIVSGSRDGTIRVWNAATGEHRRELPGHRSSVNAIALTADGKSLVSCGTDAVVPLRDLATGKEIRRFDLRLPREGFDPSVPHQVISLALSADGGRLSAYSLAEGDERAAFHVWDAGTGKSFVRRGFTRSPTYLELAPDGRNVLEYICPPNAKREQIGEMPLALRDLGTGRIRVMMPQPDEFEFVRALTRDGLTLATVTSKQVPRSMDENDIRYTIRLWDIPTGKEYLAVGGDEGVHHPPEAMAFSPDGRWLATAHSNRSVIVWDALTGRNEMTITGMDAVTKCLAFSPDGRKLVTGHTDGSALVWNVPVAAPKAAALSKKELESLWIDLGDADARRARAALTRLAESPKEAAAFLAERMTPTPALPTDRIPGWLADLGHEKFVKREAATKALAALGDRVENYLIDFLATNTSSEAGRRADRLLSAIPPIPPPEILRRVRAIPVLGWADTPEARAALKRLTSGDPAARETSAAHAALRGRP